MGLRGTAGPDWKAQRPLGRLFQPRGVEALTGGQGDRPAYADEWEAGPGGVAGLLGAGWRHPGC